MRQNQEAVSEPGPAPPPTPVAESRLERGRRTARRAVLYGSLVAFLFAAIYLILLIVENTDRVKVSYVFGDARAPLLWIVVVSGIAGWVLGIATHVLLRRRTRRTR
jgi:uncharacterized integral membrane protein